MGWTLRLVETGTRCRSRHHDLFEFGEIAAPCGLDDIGLTLAQAKDVLASLQQWVVALQEEALAEKARATLRLCPQLRLKDYRVRHLDTLFGRMAIKVPRLLSCDRDCEPVTLLDGRRHARSTLDYDRIRASLSAWMSYRAAAELLAMLLPVNAGAAIATFHGRAQAFGQSLITSPVNQKPVAKEISLALDTTYVRSNQPDLARQWEILVGAAESEAGLRCYFGAPIRDRAASLKVVHRALIDVGRSTTTKLTAFTDGDDTMRWIAAHVGVRDRPILDWFHIAMRIRHVQVSAGALPTRVPSQAVAKAAICEGIERIRWKLWHGHPSAMRDGMAQMREALSRYRYELRHRYKPAPSRLVRSRLFALEQYVSGQQAWTTNYARRSRTGQRVGTSLAEGTAENLVNRRMNKSQHMRWSRHGALNLLQIRAAIINGTLVNVAQDA